MLIAMTGASGFVGRHVKDRLTAAGHSVKCLSRLTLSNDDRLAGDLHGCDWLVNCAGQKRADSSLGWSANEQLPVVLYGHAVAAGCAGMVHISSVAALGSTTPAGQPVGDDQEPAPDTEYGISKLIGDRALDQARVPGTRLCILRPPLLFGPDAGGLFGILKKAAKHGLPLPVAGIDAKRSVMHVDNLAAAVIAAIGARADGSYVVTDLPPVQPAALYRKMLNRAGYGDRCFSIGRGGRALLAKLLGNRRANSLLKDSWFDGSRFAAATGCVYPLDLETAIGDAIKG